MVFNTVSSVVYEMISLAYGFIVPQMILQYYGSSVNGLVSSITQFLGFISLAECGVASVVRSTLYKPLAEHDDVEISKIIKSSNNFFTKLGLLLLFYVILLAIVYPMKVRGSFGVVYSSSLVLIIAIITFSQYFFGMTNRVLLSADQKIYIQQIVQCVTLILNTVACFFVIKFGFSIHIYKLLTSLFFLLQPLTYHIYVNRHYDIDKKIILKEEPIKQKWNGLAQHIATVVLVSTDTIVLTLFSSLENVSIYAVYNIVENGMKSLIAAFSNGMQALLGNMYAKKENELLLKTFNSIEWLLHTVIVYAFTCTGILILPFVQVYTRKITDVNYLIPSFAILITAAQAMYSIRIPYNMMVLAAGHYKQTQNSAIIEAILNISISVLLVIKLGLVGVAIGTLIAMTYRTIYFAFYLQNNILCREIKYFIKHICVDFLMVVVMVAITLNIKMLELSYLSWFVEAIKVASSCFIVVVLINAIFYKKDMENAVGLLIKKKSSKK